MMAIYIVVELCYIEYNGLELLKYSCLSTTWEKTDPKQVRIMSFGAPRLMKVCPPQTKPSSNFVLNIFSIDILAAAS